MQGIEPARVGQAAMEKFEQEMECGRRKSNIHFLFFRRSFEGSRFDNRSRNRFVPIAIYMVVVFVALPGPQQQRQR